MVICAAISIVSAAALRDRGGQADISEEYEDTAVMASGPALAR
jgi:hypothetical protein